MMRIGRGVITLLLAALIPGCNSDQRQLLDQAEARWREGNYDDAIRLNKLLYERDRQGRYAVQSLLNLGDIYYLNKRDPGSAAEYYKKLLEEFPGRPEELTARKQLVRIYESEYSDLTQAIAQYDAMLAVKNLEDRGKILYERANLYFKKQDYHRALRALRQLEDDGVRDHLSHLVYLKIGNIYQIQHKYAEAIPYFVKVAAAACIDCRRQGILELESTYESLYEFNKAIETVKRLDPTEENKRIIDTEVHRLQDKRRRVDSGYMTWRTHP
jgi:tetratricopeptide (TPR) repeat protein